MTMRRLEDFIIFEKGNDTIVIVPSEDVLLSEVKLPKLNRHKLQQALPYALEEQLIDEVGELHFSILNIDHDGQYPVAIVSHKKMREWLEILKSHDVTPSILIPATLALPSDENVWKTYVLNDRAFVRSGKFSGLTADINNLNQILGEDILAETLSQEAFEALLMHAVYDPQINLLQGIYAAKRKMKHTKNVWKYAGIAASVWIFLLFFSNVISFFILHHAENKFNQKMVAIYDKQFPHATSMTAPRERLQQKLKEVELQSQKNNFLSLLATTAKAFKKNPGVRIQSLQYQQPVLTLEISSAAFDALDAITQDLMNAGLSVKQQNALTANTQVKATLVISAGTA